MIRDRVVTRGYGGLEVRKKTKVTIEIIMSEDWAECVAHQAEEAFTAARGIPNEDGELSKRQELIDFIDAIDEALK